jgi:hypothetical protein
MIVRLQSSGAWLPALSRPLCHARALLSSNLREREPGADRDDAEDGMARILRQAQRVQLLPGSNANVGRIQVRPLFRQLESPPLRPFMLLECQTLGVGSDELEPGVGR